MSMKSKLESAYAKALTGTFKVINPIKKTIKKTAPLSVAKESFIINWYIILYTTGGNRYGTGTCKGGSDGRYPWRAAPGGGEDTGNLRCDRTCR